MQLLVEITAFSGLPLSFFLILLLVFKSNKNKADFILIGWFLGIFVHCLYFYLIVTQEISDSYVFRSLGSALPILHLPVIFLYVKELMQGSSLKDWGISISPFLIYFTAYLMALKNQFLIYQDLAIYISGSSPLWVRILSPSMIVVVITFLWLIRKIVTKQTIFVHQNFSNERNKTIAWLNYWLVTVAIGALIIVLSILLADAGLYPYYISYSITFLFVDIQLLIVGIYGLKQTSFFTEGISDKNRDDFSRNKYSKSRLQDTQAELLKNQLITSIKDEKLYLNPELSILDLANHTGYSSAQISQAFSQKIGENFFDFVNRHRIEEVKKKLSTSEFNHLTILAIALESGFSSKSTFNKCFKKFTGFTPSAYKKKAKN